MVETEYNELEIANEILRIVGNIDDPEDALNFARIYIESMEKGREDKRDAYNEDVEDLNIALIYKHLSEVDHRFNKCTLNCLTI